MRVVIMTAGSRGDVAPYTGLGAALARSGHEVTLVTHGLFESLAAGSGVRFQPTPVDPHAVSHSDRGRSLHTSTTGLGKLLRAASMARSAAEEMTDALVRAARGADAVLAAGAVAPLGLAIASSVRPCSADARSAPWATAWAEWPSPPPSTGSSPRPCAGCAPGTA
jgi:UDP:flavonoid glycosyltransferase YjiC (YdhE family)